MFAPPSPDTRIATAPASAASSLLTDPGHGSQRAPFGMDPQRSAPTHSMNALLRSTGFPRDDDAESSARSPHGPA